MTERRMDADQEMARTVSQWLDRTAASLPSNPTGRDELLARVATTPQRAHRWLPQIRTRGFTMFSALKFIAAGVIVALFGGFLLAGVLTTPQGDEVLPAAVTESPSPMTESPSPMTESPSPMTESPSPMTESPSPTTTEELLSGMVTEEVEPGVFRVVNDGVRDLSYPVGWGGAGFVVDVTPDGSVWLLGRTGSSGLYRLGEERVFEGPRGWPSHREVAPDGTLWAIGHVPGGRGNGIFFSFDGEGWTVRATTTDFMTALAIGPFGTVWVLAEDEDKNCPDIEDDACHGAVLLRLEDDGSLTTIEDWADVYDGEPEESQLAVSPDGDVWLVGALRHRPKRAELLLRFDGEGWEAIPGPEGWNPGDMGRYLDIDPDGALWVQARAAGDLARFDDRGWATFTQADGVKRWDQRGSSRKGRLDVAADGSLWLLGSRTDEGCGVTHYHGTTWTSYLAGSCIEDFAIAPDGSVWLGAGHTSGPLDLYVITPEAVAAAE